MKTKRKILWSAAVALPLLFLGYLAVNDWHLVPSAFRTYAGKGAPVDKDTAGAAAQ